MWFKLIRDLLVINEHVKYYFKPCFKMAIHKAVQVKKVSKESPLPSYRRELCAYCIAGVYYIHLPWKIDAHISLRPIAEVNQWGGGDIYLVPPPIIQVCVCVCMAILRLAVSLSCLLFMSVRPCLLSTRDHVNSGTGDHVKVATRAHVNSGGDHAKIVIRAHVNVKPQIK
jgi:hypothetical protein